jgi:hypothetical protein
MNPHCHNNQNEELESPLEINGLPTVGSIDAIEDILLQWDSKVK